MIQRNCDARIPHPGAYSDEDSTMLDAAYRLLEAARPLIERQALHEALETIWTVVRAANAYVDRQAPWTLRKTDPDRMATVLYVLAAVIRHLAIPAQPIVAGAAGRLLD